MQSYADFLDRVRDVQTGPLRATDISILQVNLGYRCNMSCRHCHIEAGPDRAQMMTKETVETVLDVLRNNHIPTLDITGGAPEMNPHFSYLVKEARRAGHRVIVRTNLTIFFEKGMEQLPEFISENSVWVIASLPCYMKDNVDSARGKGTFEKSIKALSALNSLGYADGDERKRLDLVYNPSGPFLPPAQKPLEEDYRRELKGRFGIVFNSLYAFANMPIGRFRDMLAGANGLEEYMGALISAFNPETLQGLMCRRLISVGWDGRLYDCDFNQMLGVALHQGCPQHIREFDHSVLNSRDITVGNHCYACTAGQGFT